MFNCLEAQGLHSAFSFGQEKQSAFETIRHLGYVQLDTLAVVARAHHHTLWMRTDAYWETHLSDLVRERKIFEYWTHAAAYLSITIWPNESFRPALIRACRQDEYAAYLIRGSISAHGLASQKDITHLRPGMQWPVVKMLSRMLKEVELVQLRIDGIKEDYFAFPSIRSPNSRAAAGTNILSRLITPSAAGSGC